MTRFDFDTPVDRRYSSSEKWDRYQGRDILPMWVADMDFRSPPAVLSALRDRIDHGVFGYTKPPKALNECVVEHLEARYRWRIEPEWLVWIPGLVSGLNIACRCVGDPGDSVMSATPVYPPFLTAPRHFQRKLQRLPLAERRGRWSLDFDRMAADVSSSTRLFLLCNPHNPVGRVFTRPELRQLAEICLRNETIICSDEIHCDLVLDPDKPHVPTATLDPEIEKRTITLMAPSKTFNIPGLGCSFAVISSPDLRRRFTAAMSGIVPHVNALGYTAALAAYRDGWPWLEELLVYLRANRDLVVDRINRMEGLSTAPAEATYLAWIDARRAGIENPAAFFENGGIGLSDGREFDGAGFVRLNFGCPRALLSDALDRMGKALADRAPEVENPE